MNQVIMDAFVLRNRIAKPQIVPNDICIEYDQFLPANIIYVWKNLGFNFCEHQAIQFVNPADYKFMLFDLDLSSLENQIFAITALGDLLVWNNPEANVSSVWLYSLQDMTKTKLANEYELDRWFAQNLQLHNFFDIKSYNFDLQQDINEKLMLLALKPYAELGAAKANLKLGQIIAREQDILDEKPGELKTFDAHEYMTDWLTTHSGDIFFTEVSVEDRKLGKKVEKPKNIQLNAPEFENLKPQNVFNPTANQPAPKPMLMPGPAATSTYNPNLNLANVIVERLRQCKYEPIIELKPVERPHALLDTKIGGPYYLPNGEEPLKNPKTGSELALLAQINFTQLQNLKDFPEQGLLQIFLDPNPHSFNVTAHPTEQVAWRIRFFPEAPSYMEIDRKGYMPNMPDHISTLPFSTERYLTLQANDAQQRISWDDFPLNAMLNRYCADLMPASPTPADLTNLREARKQAVETLKKEFKPGVTNDYIIQIGGTPTFNRPDPRPEDPRFPGIRTPNVLLLQIPCFDGLNWGGNNVVHFFISRKDLRAKNFDNVLIDMPRPQ